MKLLDRALARLAIWNAQGITRGFLRAVSRARDVQDRLLRELIDRATPTDFGRDHSLARIRTYEDYAAAVPIRDYAGMRPYIEKVREGHTAALFAPGTPILMFALTSGTTAEPKYIPISPQALADCRKGWNIWGLKALLDHPGAVLRHIVQVTSPMRDHDSPSGVPCGAITGLLAATQKRIVRRYYTCPARVGEIADATAKYYTIMRLSIPRDVGWMVTANPSTLLLLAKTVDESREKMIRDIRDGTLTDAMPVDATIRAELQSRLQPEPECARRLESIVSRTGRLLPADYWSLNYLAHWTGGTMGLYRNQLREFFGDVPVRDIGLIASEGRMSIPVADESAGGLLAVTSQFFEFIPANEYGSPSVRTLRCHELSIGEEYFLVLTNASGLHRYDLGDRVRVTAMQGATPIIEFLSRDAHTASVAGEKLTEHQAVLAMQRVGAKLGRSIELFVVAPRWGTPPWYRLYIEGPPADWHKNLARAFDDHLGEVNFEYASRRKTGRLGDIELIVLGPGQLHNRDLQMRATKRRTAEQFKHQYLLAQPDTDADLSEPERPHAGSFSH